MMKKFNHSFLKCIIFIAINSVFAIQCMTLHEAVRQNDLQTVQQLLRDGANPNQKIDPESITPLFIAVSNENVRMIKLLLKQGASVKGNGYDLLLSAAHDNNRKIMKLLLEHGANPNNYTVIHSLIYDERLKALKLLSKFGADFQQMGSWSIATYYGKINILKYFIKIGIPVSLPICNSGFPSYNVYETVSLLLNHGASPVVRANLSSDTVFKLLWAYARALDQEEEFVTENRNRCEPLLRLGISDTLGAQTCDARLQLLYRKHNTKNINDLLFKRETGMIRLP